MEWFDWVGYLGSALVVGSFLINNNIRLTRIINGLGCIAFVIYGIFIDSLPIIIPNAFLFFIQVYFLFIKKD